MKKSQTHIKIYSLQEQDTIYSIAEKFGLSVDAIRDFHNERSGFNNRIPFFGDIPPHVSKILLSIEALEKVKSHTHGGLLALKNQNSLYCDFKLLKHNYGVILHLETQKEKKRIHYTTTLICSKEFEYIYDLTIHKSQVYIDYKIPDMLAESLAASLAKPLYPIAIQINRSGKLLSVTNQTDILKRWETKRPKLLHYFKSPIAEQQIRAVDIAYKNPIAIEKVVKRDIFFNLYFSGLYNRYLSSLEINNILRVPLYPFINGIEYQVQQYLSPYLNANGNISIHQTGKVSDSRSSEDIIQQKDEPHFKGNPLQGELDISYEFCNEQHIIKSIAGTISLLVNNKTSKKVTIEAYRLA